MNFLLYEENFVFFFISAYTQSNMVQERSQKESLLWESKREWEGKVAHFTREKETLETSKIVRIPIIKNL